MTHKELTEAGDVTIIEQVYCTRCGKEYSSRELTLIYLDLRHEGYGEGYVWCCATEGCRGTMGYSTTGSITPVVVREG